MQNKKTLSVNNKHRFFIVTTLICLLFVVIAGSLVKATDSGMGCPDWPKCFGHLIPPTNPEDVHWGANKTYFKGQMVIANNQLWSAKTKLTTSTEFDLSKWELYDKHSYAIYNPTHTIIEYINRLVSVLLGFFALGMLFFSLKSKNKKHISIAVFTMLLILFEAWLGKTVVDSELSPLKISIHLYGAFILLILVTLALVNTKKTIQLKPKKSAIYLIGTGLILLLIQLFLGTKLREVFDHFYNNLNTSRDFWIADAGLVFLVHRSFSLVYAGVLYLTFLRLRKQWMINKRLKRSFIFLCLICLTEILTGIIMTYFNVPRFIQPTHVLLSALLLCTHCFLYFEYKRSLKLSKTTH